jgi:hypothetical protein
MKSSTFQLLKALHQDELIFIADLLSHNRQNWNYNKRRKAAIRDAIKSNECYDSVAQCFKKSLGREMASGDTFPRVLQIEKLVIGPLDFLASVESRSRYEADTIFNIFEGHIRSNGLVERILNDSTEIPKDVQQNARQHAADKAIIVQLMLTYFTDKKICSFINKLIEEQKIKLEITSLYENVEYYWLVTKYGLALTPEGEAVEKLVDLLKETFSEEELLPELKSYSGDFQTKLLEFCIMENPQNILKDLFGLPNLRRIAKKMGFAAGQIDNIEIASSLVLIGLGFDVPPELSGISSSIANIELFQKELFESQRVERKSGIMSQIFVEIEKVIRDITYFYTGFLWKNSLEKLHEEIEQDMPQLFPRQQKLLALNRFIKRKFKVEKPFEKFGLGDYISLLKSINQRVCEKQVLVARLMKKTNRKCIIENESIKALDEISPYRSSFMHAKDYPGDEKCVELVRSTLRLLKYFREKNVAPIALRISREVSDEYGKSYAECIDEDGNGWLLYEEYLDTAQPYLFCSLTPNIAINPAIVEKIL